MSGMVILAFFSLFLVETAVHARDCRGVEACEQVVGVMTKVADYQLAHPNYPVTDWTNGAFYAGIFATYQATGQVKYRDVLRQTFEAARYLPGPRLRHADDLAITQTYMDLYEEFRESSMLEPSLKRWDQVVSEPRQGRKDWWWCDALFMAPPAMAKLSRITGNPRYFEVMDEMFWDTYNFLYDPAEFLFYRDANFFELRERNGQKVFWSRGNGWVIGGLVRILKELPATHADRGRYENLLREMLVKVKDLQQGDGFWRPSLLDPLSTPRGESSGTGFYLYGMAYAMRTGLVDKLQFMDHANRAWGALVGAVDVDGRLGWVQPIGYRPEPVRFEDSDVFGTGAMLLGASEYLELIMNEQGPSKL